MKKIVLIIVAAFLFVLAGLFFYVKIALPDVGPPPVISIDPSPSNIARGEYLANNVMVCADCHSRRDMSRFAGPVSGKLFAGGGEEFTKKYGLPGDFYAPNLTPFHLKDWTDVEIYRAITTGVSKDGHPLFPIMPYHLYGQADPEDIKAVIAYLRTLPEVKNEVPNSEVDFPVSFFLHLMPQKANPVKRPDFPNKIETGKYLTTIGGCIDCHTPLEKGKPNFEKAFEGGREFMLPTGTVRSANLTPDPDNFMGIASSEDFVARFKAYADSSYDPPVVGSGFNTVMPWNLYARMDSTEMAAIYEYLHSLKPVKKQVELFTVRSDSK
jgi:mono/diheme cytochrome c family protein